MTEMYKTYNGDARGRTRGPDQFQWTPERVEALTVLWSTKMSAAEIASALGGGLSRSAVLGKVRRLRLPMRDDRPRSGRPRSATSRTGKRILRPPPPPELPQLPALTPDEFDAAIPQDQRRTLLQLRDGVCRWPVGDPLEEGFFFCGGTVHGCAPYCHHHLQRAHPPA